ncbi:MAG: hypothetical protein JOZ38_09800 [Candidatus Eremiobacteraeota bacterium]|nr:hypothetical protein [Candidatus Eremiobacteraeota bacterium]
MNAVRSALNRLIDYAGLFPPASLAMDAAVETYERVRESPYAWIAGRFIVPASRLSELAEALGRRVPFALSVILDAAATPAWLNEIAAICELVAAAQRESRWRIETLELALPAPRAARETFDAPIGQVRMVLENAGLRALPAFVEVPRTPRWRGLLAGAMAALHRARLGAKVRCGGAAPDAVPSPEDLAAFVRLAVEGGVPFKATAGLHHPVRHRDPDGRPVHGFVNLMAATLLARTGTSVEALAEVLGDEDAAAFALAGDTFTWREQVAHAAEVAQMRDENFVAYGSCSFDEPTEDLVALGVLTRETVAT